MSVGPALAFGNAFAPAETSGGTSALGAFGGPWGLAASGALTLAQIAARKVGQGRKTANKLTQGGPQEQLDQQLAQISQLANTDPEAAATQLQSAWSNFYNTAQAWIAKGGNEAKVAKQALSTPALIQTVDALAAQLGIPSLRSNGAQTTMPVAVSGPAFTDQSLSAVASGDPLNVTQNSSVLYPPGSNRPPARGGWNVGDIINKGVSIYNKTRTPASPSPATPKQSPATTPSNKPVDTKNPDGSTTRRYPDGRTTTYPAGTQVPKDWSWLTDFVIPAGASAGLNLFGGYLASRASNQAAQIEADAANRAAELQAQTTREALALQGRMYDQSRADLMPWLQRGNAAGNRLQYMMGLPGYDQSLSAIARGVQ